VNSYFEEMQYVLSEHMRHACYKLNHSDTVQGLTVLKFHKVKSHVLPLTLLIVLQIF
jgi:hypothetical protein